MADDVQLSAETLRRRKLLSRTWGVVVVTWSLVRALVVWAALSEYGINPYAYLAIDLASAFVDAITTPRMVLAFIDSKYRSAVKWMMASLVAFVVPDLYIFISTRHLPRRVIFVIAIIISITGTVAVISVFRKVRAGRREPIALTEEVLGGS